MKAFWQGFGLVSALGIGGLCGIGLYQGGQAGLAVAILLAVLVAAVVLVSWLALTAGRRLALAEARIDDLGADHADAIDTLRTQVEDLPGQVETRQARSAEAVAAELKVLQKLLIEMARDRTRAHARPQAAPRLASGAEEQPSMDAAAALDVVQHALADNRIELHLQPIVKLPSRRTLHFEALSRVRDEQGAIVFPREYVRPAESAGLISALDTLLLFRCVDLIRKLGPRRPGARLFCNLSRASLSDRDFLSEFTRFMRDNRSLSDRLVFELRADDFEALAPQTRDQLAALTRLGFPLSIDTVTDFDFDPAEWAALRVQFVKIEARRLLDPQALRTTEPLARQLRRYNIELVATHVEDERTAIEILELGITLGQGYLYGVPKAAREEAQELPAPVA